MRRVDELSPISGIALEQYAALCAALDGREGAPELVAGVLAAYAVTVPQYEAARAGWTERMQDPAAGGAVAMAFLPVYQAALASSSGGAARMSYVDFLHASAAIRVHGFDPALAALGLSASDWGHAFASWQARLLAEPAPYAGHFALVAAESTRLAAGVAPRRVSVSRETPHVALPSAKSTQAPRPAPSATSTQAPSQAPSATSTQAPPQAPPPAPATEGAASWPPGTRVVVAWPDGKRYPAAALQEVPGHVLVEFDGGGHHWVPEHALTRA